MLLLIILAVFVGISFGLSFIEPAKEFFEGLIKNGGDFLVETFPDAMAPYLQNASANYIAGVHFTIGAVFTILAFVGVILSAVRKKYLSMFIKLIILLASVAAFVCSLFVTL